MLCGTNSIMQNIPHIQSEYRKYSYIIVSPIEHCYGYE